MNKTIFSLLLFGFSILFGKTVEPKIMRAQNYHKNYEHSSHHQDTKNDVLSSSVEASSEIIVMVTVQASSEITSEEHQGEARLSYLDSNRVQITQNIAQGQGEYITTLLEMMKLPTDEESLEKLQKNFDSLIYLSHNDFLDKVEALI
jgi:hypothetical protein